MTKNGWQGNWKLMYVVDLESFRALMDIWLPTYGM